MVELLFFLLVFALLGAWWVLSSNREAALLAAKRHCQQMDVQFLDDSIMADGYKFTRNKAGNLVLLQRFRFEFTTLGDQRYSGRIHMIGKRVMKMDLEPHRL